MTSGAAVRGQGPRTPRRSVGDGAQRSRSAGATGRPDGAELHPEGAAAQKSRFAEIGRAPSEDREAPRSLKVVLLRLGPCESDPGPFGTLLASQAA